MANVIIIDAPQRSPEWRAARAGRLTGSRACDAIDFTKTKGESYKRRDYRYQLIAERLSGAPQEDGYVNAEMQRGIDKEPEALMAYEVLTQRVARTTGFLQHPELLAGCSLDGHVGNFEGIVEVKCPKTATHIKYLRMGDIPEDYMPQILHNLWISGAEWCDFLSFDDRLPEHMRTFLKRVTPTVIAIRDYEAKALQFLAEVDREIAALEGWKAEAAGVA